MIHTTPTDPLNVFVVLAHAEPRSFNGAMFHTAVETLQASGHSVRTSDLYAQAFDPVSDRRNFTGQKNPDYFKQQIEEMHASETGSFAPDLEAEIEKVEWCHLMIWQFPLWWFGLPGILKGWVDRVFAMGRFYGSGRMYDQGVLRGKRAMLALTTGGRAEIFVKGGYFGDIHAILRPIQRGILQFTGFEVLAPHIVHAPVRMTPEQRQEQLEAYARRLEHIAAEMPIEVGEY